MTDKVVGMMDSAYFVGRRELLEWLNSTLSLNLQKIEETASGAVACQLMDALFPGSVPMSKVNWEAKHDFQFVPNYKLLQKAFKRHAVSRHIDVPKLIRGKYQDNLEFMQWFKAFFESQAAPEDYDPVQARARGRGGRQAGANLKRSSQNAAPRTTAAPRPRTSGASQARVAAVSTNKENRARPSRESAGAASKARIEAAEQQLREKTERCEQLESIVEGLEGEREFYYSKLLAIEALMQSTEAELPEGEAGDLVRNLIRRSFGIMYDASEEEAEAPSAPAAPEAPEAPADAVEAPAEVAAVCATVAEEPAEAAVAAAEASEAPVVAAEPLPVA